MAQMLFTLEVPLYGTIFLLKLNPAIQFSNLKPKLARNAARCNNRDNFANLTFILKVSVFSEAYLEPS